MGRRGRSADEPIGRGFLPRRDGPAPRHGSAVRIWSMPVEIPDPVRFEEDTGHHTYNPEQAQPVLDRSSRASRRCSTSAAPRSSARRAPSISSGAVFDLAVTRFSGRLAPPREGPAFHARRVFARSDQPRLLARRAGRCLEPAFYAYAVPEPAGLKEAPVRPSAAYYHRAAGRVHPALRGRAHIRRSGSGTAGVHRQHL